MAPPAAAFLPKRRDGPCVEGRLPRERDLRGRSAHELFCNLSDNRGAVLKVLVLGSGVIGTSAWYLAREGHEVTVLERQAARRWRPASPMPAKSRPAIPRLGRPRRAGEGDQVDADAPQPAGHVAAARPGDVALGRPMLANCTEPAYPQQEPHGPLAEYSRDCLKALRAETGIAYDDRAQGTLQLFRTQKQLDGTARTSQILKSSALRGARPRRLRRGRAGAGGRRTSSSARCDCRATRPATASSSRNRLAEMAPELGVSFRYGMRIEALGSRAAASPACSPPPACCGPTATCWRWAAIVTSWRGSPRSPISPGGTSSGRFPATARMTSWN